MLSAAVRLASFTNPTHAVDYLRSPWSAGQYTYATDGIVAVRVDAQDGVGRLEHAPHDNLDRWMADASNADLVPMPHTSIPTPKTWTCDECDGRGTEHDCPECGCECKECGGTGRCSQPVCIRWRGVYIAARNWIRLAALPDCRIGLTNQNGHVPFSFSGGVGLLMPMCAPGVDVLVVEAGQP